jgi:SAM-dependent methyltransferase
MSVIWHDLECGAYLADLPLWRSLAAAHGDPVLDVGAGTGRVTLDLAARGHHVIALDRDPVLLAELARRSRGLAVETVVADARDFAVSGSFPLIIVPMQTIQLLGGSAGRKQFLANARAHLAPAGGLVALAITETLDLYQQDRHTVLPIADIRELDGVVYSSQPTAVRRQDGGFVLERLRETVTPKGERTVVEDVIRIDGLGVAELEGEGVSVGLRPAGRESIPPTRDHVGSEVVMLAG